jgi:hypothetical protein
MNSWFTPEVESSSELPSFITIRMKGILEKEIKKEWFLTALYSTIGEKRRLREKNNGF